MLNFYFSNAFGNTLRFKWYHLWFLLIICVSSCSKPSSEIELEEKIPQATISNKKRTPHEVPSQNIVLTSKDTLARKSSLPSKSIDKITQLLNSTQERNAKTEFSSSFSATEISSNYWSCHAESSNITYPGTDWYLFNSRTGGYTYLGSTSGNSIDFFASSPDYEYYFVYAYNSVSAEEATTNKVLMGNPYYGTYPGVVYNNGLLEFYDEQAYEEITDQLENAYEAHSAAFYDQYDHLTDAQVEALETTQGFDDLQPYKDFENYFGVYSLRAKIEDDMILMPNYDVEAAYATSDDSELVLLNSIAQVVIAGILRDRSTTSQSPASCYAEYSESSDNYPDPSDSNLKIYARLWKNNNFGSRIKIIVKARKASNNKRIATKLNIRNHGYVYADNCVNNVAFDSNWRGEKRRKRYSYRFHPPAIPLYFGTRYFKPNYVTGEFKARGYSFNLVLN